MIQNLDCIFLNIMHIASIFFSNACKPNEWWHSTMYSWPNVVQFSSVIHQTKRLIIRAISLISKIYFYTTRLIRNYTSKVCCMSQNLQKCWENS